MVKVCTKRYEAEHGRKPRGVGYWSFRIGREVVRIPGSLSYADARRGAENVATARRVGSIEVAP